MDATVEISARVRGADQLSADAGESVTILLADEDAPTRLGLRRALEHHGFSVVAEASDAEQAVDAALRHRPNVCLLDMYIPGGGITAAELIYPALPGTRIAMLADANGEADLLDAIYAGADGYLLKSTAPDRMTLALRALARGEAVLPRALTGRVLTEVRAASARRSLPGRSRLRYMPRFARHLRRRMRSGMSLPAAWQSARMRMHSYD